MTTGHDLDSGSRSCTNSVSKYISSMKTPNIRGTKTRLALKSREARLLGIQAGTTKDQHNCAASLGAKDLISPSRSRVCACVPQATSLPETRRHPGSYPLLFIASTCLPLQHVPFPQEIGIEVETSVLSAAGAGKGRKLGRLHCLRRAHQTLGCSVQRQIMLVLLVVRVESHCVVRLNLRPPK